MVFDFTPHAQDGQEPLAVYELKQIPPLLARDAGTDVLLSTIIRTAHLALCRERVDRAVVCPPRAAVGSAVEVRQALRSCDPKLTNASIISLHLLFALVREHKVTEHQGTHGLAWKMILSAKSCKRSPYYLAMLAEKSLALAWLGSHQVLNV